MGTSFYKCYVTERVMGTTVGVTSQVRLLVENAQVVCYREGYGYNTSLCKCYVTGRVIGTIRHCISYVTGRVMGAMHYCINVTSQGGL